MSAFKEVKRFDHPALEEEILGWWEQNSVFERSISDRADAQSFTFYEGPPTANGRPGIHHVMARTIKDTFCRYKTMKGFLVDRKAGWDTHGLPVEIEVEKELGLKGREQVIEYGIDRYNRACRDSVLRYTELWNKLTIRMGYWVDLSDPYVTYQTKYIETLWWIIKQLYEKGLLYKGYKIQWYSPSSGTVLSSHEVSLGYKEVQDPSVYVRFPVEDEENTFFLAWTTTPWTLISNTALAVGEQIDYVKVRRQNGDDVEYLYLARDLVARAGEGAEVVETLKGADLLGRTYRPVFPYFEADVQPGEAWRVVAADFVSTEDGTGIVHMAPAFGADDFEVGRRENLPLFNPITPDGTFTDKVELVAGQWFKDADKVITRDLRERGLLFRHDTYLHNYPHDWRKGTPLMSYPVESWFIRTTAFRERMMELNDTINWQPEAIGRGRFGEWLKNNVDWALSRRRFWGTPLPIWMSDKDGSSHMEVIGSIAELREKCGDQLPAGDDALDLHRPFVDELTWPAPDGGTMRRVPDLIDVWFDSGAMPFAQWHYPFENKEVFERNFPADFIAEGVDQTRGWFYTLHALAVMVMDDVAYKNVVVNGLVLAEDGEKMSKTKGNAVDPFQTIERYGADIVRWYMMSNTVPWENIRFSERGMQDTARKFFSTLENVYSFFATYANVDGFRPGGVLIPVDRRAELDRWIISRLNSTIAEADSAYDQYNPTRAARAVEHFIEELSNWYIRRSRRRFWKEVKDDPNDKQAAYQTVFECLTTVARLISPIAPFFSEWLYLALNEQNPDRDSASVHLENFPAASRADIDIDLERRMGLARQVTSIVLALRNEAQLNVRQPLPRILVVARTEQERADIDAVRGIILDEVNVKQVEYVAGSSAFVTRTARPNFKALGKRLGPLMKPVTERVRAMNDAEIDRFEREGSIGFHLSGSDIMLQEGDIEVLSEGVEGWLVQTEDGTTVALDTALNDELVAEGLARETINRVQNMRKAADFDVTDRILIAFQASENLARAIDQHSDWIRNETLAIELDQADQPGGERIESFEIGAETLVAAISRLQSRNGNRS
jgi:isoleucyl-tRNA synthetase